MTTPQVEAWAGGWYAVIFPLLIWGTLPTGPIIPPYCAVTQPLLYIAYSAGYRQAIAMLKENQKCPATAHR